MASAEQMPLLEQTAAIPPTACAGGTTGAPGYRLPQVIAHRGYSGAWPENSVAAFRAAVEAGSHAVETDVHLTRDGVVVLSHDATLKRCFGINEKVADCDWSYLSTLRTLRAPHEPMARLIDLLAYLTEPGLEDIWVLLDVKVDDNADDLLSRIAAAIASVPATKPWNERIIVGCWTSQHMKTTRKRLPGFPIAYVGWSLPYAAALLLDRDHGVGYDLSRLALAGPVGRLLQAAARRAGRPVYVWTVDDPGWMAWSVRREFDGVVTGEPERFREVCRQLESGGGEKAVGERAVGGPRLGVRPGLRDALLVGVAQVAGVVLTVLVLMKDWQVFRTKRAT